MSDPRHVDPAGLLAESAAVVPSGLSRRRMLRGAAGVGAAGLAAAAVTGAAAAPARAVTARSAAAPARVPEEAADAGPSEPVVVHLRDARSGELDVFSGVGHTRVHDPELAARLARMAT
jgi:hypothetical protein